jgi:hypothetical protein
MSQAILGLFRLPANHLTGEYLSAHAKYEKRRLCYVADIRSNVLRPLEDSHLFLSFGKGYFQIWSKRIEKQGIFADSVIPL